MWIQVFWGMPQESVLGPFCNYLDTTKKTLARFVVNKKLGYLAEHLMC